MLSELLRFIRIGVDILFVTVFSMVALTWVDMLLTFEAPQFVFDILLWMTERFYLYLILILAFMYNRAMNKRIRARRSAVH